MAVAGVRGRGWNGAGASRVPGGGTGGAEPNARPRVERVLYWADPALRAERTCCSCALAVQLPIIACWAAAGAPHPDALAVGPFDPVVVVVVSGPVSRTRSPSPAGLVNNQSNPYALALSQITVSVSLSVSCYGSPHCSLLCRNKKKTLTGWGLDKDPAIE